MSRRRAIHPRTLVQVLIAGLLVMTAVVVVDAARSGASRSAPMVVDGGRAPSGSGDGPSQFVTCQRTLPERSTLREGAAVVPVGRVRSADVLECPDLFDLRVVTFVGEVVGDILPRTDGAWVLVNDDAYALETGPLHAARDFRGLNSGLSVWLPDGVRDVVDQPGNARWRGDVIRISGVLQRADPLDGGSLTIRASSAELVADALPVDVPFNRRQAVVAALLSLITLALVAVERRAARP